MFTVYVQIDMATKGKSSASLPDLSTESTLHDPRLEIKEIKGTRAQLKSNVTRLISKTDALVKSAGSRTQMRDLIVRIEERVKEADLCNRRLYRLLDESEHESIGSWFLEIEQRAEDAVARAKEHIEERNEEPRSILCGSVVSSRRSSKL